MRRLAFLLLAVLLALLAPRAWAGAPLALGADPDVDAWPAVTVLDDAAATLGAPAALARRDWAAPTGPGANLGVRDGAVWIRLPIAVDAAGSGDWLLEVDHPLLDRIDVWRVDAGVALHVGTLGDRVAYAERAYPARPHVLPLDLGAGRHELLLRVQTKGSMLVPLRLVRGDAFHARESRFQWLQGVAAGIGLALIAYALAHGLASRDPMFAFYGVTVAGTTLFFLAYRGLAPQLLWPSSRRLADNAVVLVVLVAEAAAFALVERMLDVRSAFPRLARLLLLLGWISLAAALAFAVGVLGYRQAQLFGTYVGPLSVLLAVRVAWRRLHGGDAAAPWLFAGWAIYGFGVVTMALLLRGAIGVDGFTQHAFQVATLLESVTWLRVLGLRNSATRDAADRLAREREMLRKLAHTDALTALPNRRGLLAELPAALAAATPDRLLAVCMVDLDGFKAINDRLGHDAGDELLVAVAARLKRELRRGDIVARLGGDEFVVLARDICNERDAWQIGAKLVAAFDDPFDVRGTSCRVGLTLGFALAPLDGRDGDALLKRADAAMYAGKQSGKGTVRRGAASASLVAA